MPVTLDVEQQHDGSADDELREGARVDDEHLVPPLMPLDWRGREQRRRPRDEVLASCADPVRARLGLLVEHAMREGGLAWGEDGWRYSDARSGDVVLASHLDIVVARDLLDALEMNWIWEVYADAPDDGDLVELDDVSFVSGDPFALRIAPNRSVHLVQDPKIRHAEVTSLQDLPDREQYERLARAVAPGTSYVVQPAWTIDAVTRALTQWLRYFGAEVDATFDDTLRCPVFDHVLTDIDRDGLTPLCQVCLFDADATWWCLVDVDGEATEGPLCDACAHDHGWRLRSVD